MREHGPMRGGDMTASFIRILLQQLNTENRDQFLRRLTEKEPDVQCKLYLFAKSMICTWAGQSDLSREDAVVIEDCRKICDVMGWPVDRP